MAASFTKQQLEVFFKRHYGDLCYFAFKMINDRQQAEDLVQEAFLKYWNANKEFPNEGALKSYLYLSVRNACLNLGRHEEVKLRHEESLILHQQQEDPTAADLMIRAEVLGRIHQAIEELPQGCRSVLKLSFLESLRNDEIADKLGVSVNTVKTQKARALQLLRLKLDPSTFLCLLLLWDP